MMIHNALAGKPLPIYGDGQQIRDWLYVGDHCAAIRRVLETGTLGEVLQHRRLERDAEPDDRAWLCDLLDAARRRRPALTATRSPVTDRPGHDRRYAIDARKIERELGWPAETFETGIRKTVQWYLDNAGWVSDVTSGGVPAVDRNELQAARMTPILLFGANGQVGWQLQRALSPLGTVTPSIMPSAISRHFRNPHHHCRHQTAHHRQCCRLHRRRSGGERAELARAINATAPGCHGRNRKIRWVRCWCIPYSTDYVFDGTEADTVRGIRCDGADVRLARPSATAKRR